MKHTIGQFKNQVRNALNLDIVTKDRPMKFRVVTIVLLSMAISCTMICIVKNIPH